MLYVNLLRLMILLALLETLVGCASQPRNKWSDPIYRTAISPIGITSDSYVRVQNAAVNTGKFFIVDRSQGLQSVMLEQDMTRVSLTRHRFSDRDKFSRLRKLWGVGSVLQCHLQCATKHSVFRFRGFYTMCTESVALVSTSTGAVIATAENEVQAPTGDNVWDESQAGPDWTEVVDMLVERIPKNFEKDQYTPEMEEFKQGNEQEAVNEEEGAQ